MAENAYQQAINVALSDAKGMLGKNEVPDRSEIMSYLHDGGQDLDPHKVAWCAAFVSASLQKAGLPVPTQVVKDSAFGPGAYAPNYLTYGNPVDAKNIQAGDILVANNGSHVGFAEGGVRQGPNGPEVQLLAGNERDPSGQYAPGSYTNPKTGAVAKRAQVGMVGEQWVPLSQYSARRYVPDDSAGGGGSSGGGGASGTIPQPVAKPVGTTLSSTPFSLAPPSGSIPSAGQYQPLIEAAAKKYNLDPNFLARVLYQENRFRPEGTSSAGAQGIAQFMPATAARYGVDVHNPASSIEGAAHYLSDLSTRYGGNLGLAAAGYNWGEGHVDQWLQGKATPPAETTNYVSTITGHSMNDWRADPRLPLPSTGPGRSPSGPAMATATGQPSSAAPAAPAGPLAAPPAQGDGQHLPGFTPGSPAEKSAQAALKTFGDQGGQDDKPLDVQPSPMIGPAPQAAGGPMMAGPGYQNVTGRMAGWNDLAQRGFLTQPSLQSFLSPNALPSLTGQSPGAGPSPGGILPSLATGMPGLPGTTLNTPSAAATAMLYGSLDPNDPYGRYGGAQAALGGLS